MLIRKIKNRGFTLVELMIVVAIVGVLAVLAVYGVRKYIANAKTAEARNAVGQISRDAASAIDRESLAGGVMGLGTSTAVLRSLCDSSGKVPTAVPAAQKYQSHPSDWKDTGWSCLKYSMDQPQYFQYQYVAGSTSGVSGNFTTFAWGDLNGDTTLSTFQMAGEATSGVVRIAPTVTETNPEE